MMLMMFLVCCSIILQDSGFLLGREGILVFCVCCSIIVQYLGFLLGRKGLLVFLVCCSIILQNLGFLFGREGLLIFFSLSICASSFFVLQNKSTLCMSLSCNMLMSHTIFIIPLSILHSKCNIGVVRFLLFPILQSNSVIQLQRIVVVYS